MTDDEIDRSKWPCDYPWPHGNHQMRDKDGQEIVCNGGLEED